MTLTKIEAEIEIPEGFEFDRISTKTKDGDYDISGFAIKSHNMQYSNQQIILRKKTRPAKPAYRVYIEKSDGRTYTQDAINGNRDKTLLPEKYEWLSDWIEYDPPNKWPSTLVERIAEIDLKAAKWIVDHWDDLLKEEYTLGAYDRMNDNLVDMFYWDHSPQEHNYWSKISDKLGEP